MAYKIEMDMETAEELDRIITNYSKLEKQVEELKKWKIDQSTEKTLSRAFDDLIRAANDKPKDDGKFTPHKFFNFFADKGIACSLERSRYKWVLQLEIDTKDFNKLDNLWLAIRDLEEV